MPKYTAQFLYQLHRRSRQAHSALERHQAAFYLWEFGLRTLGCVSIVEYANAGIRDPKLEGPLKNLARPMLGQWWELVREMVPVLAEHGDPEFQKIQSILLGRARDNLWDVIKLNVALQKVLTKKDDVGSQQTVRLRDLFDRMIQYRNNEWHGFLGGRDAEFYEDMSAVMLAGVWELWQTIDVLAGRQLIFIEDVRRLPSGSHRIIQWDLRGEQAEVLPPLDIVTSSTDSLPYPGRLYLVPGTTSAVETGAEDCRIDSWRLLYPLAIYEKAQQELFLYGKAHRRAGHVGYVGCTSGEHPQDVNVTDRRELLQRLLGHAVHESEVSQWTEASRAVDREDEHLIVQEDVRHSIGEFQLISRLGQGAFGTVYRAWQPAMRREVAVKRLSQPGRKEQRERFSREVQALGRVDHRHLVKVFYSGTDGEDLFYAMELIEGADLARVLEGLSGCEPSKIDSDVWQSGVSKACESARSEEAPLSSGSDFATDSRMISPNRARARGTAKKFGDGHVRHSVELIRDIADALSHLHDADVLHRDIKPGNIMITPDGDAILMDLGLAQLGDADTLTQSRQFVGTIRYSSPEQAFNAHQIDKRSDIYSLGVTCWELLTLQPFLGITAALPTDEQFIRIRRQEPESVRKYNPHVPSDLARIVSKCVDKDETQRYGSMSELVTDLNRWLNGEPVLALDPSIGYLLRKSMRKHAKAYSAAALAMLLTIGLTIAGIVFLDFARREAERLARQLKSANSELHQTLDVLENTVQQKEQLAFDLQNKNADIEKRNADLVEQTARLRLAKGAQMYDAGLYVAGSDGMVRAWNMLPSTSPLRQSASFLAYDRTTRQRNVHKLFSHGEVFVGAAFAQQGTLVVTVSLHGTIQIWDVRTGLPVEQPLIHDATITTMAMAPDGRQLATVSNTNEVRFWDILSRRPIGKLSASESRIRCITYDAESSVVAIGSDDGLIQRFDTNVLRPLAEPIDAGNSVWSLAFSPDGKRLLSGLSYQNPDLGLLRGTAQLWDLSTGAATGLAIDHSRQVSAVAFSPDGDQFATGTYEWIVRLWDANSQTPVGDPITSAGIIENIDFSRDGRHIAATGNHTAGIWNLQSREEAGERLVHDFVVKTVCFSPDGTEVLTSSTDKSARIWPVFSSAMVNTPITHFNSSSLQAAAFSPDGLRIATAATDDTVRLWDASTGCPLAQPMQHQSDVTSVVFSPDGKQIISGSVDRTVRTWDSITGRSLGEPLLHDNQVNAIAFSPDGGKLAVGCAKNTFVVWDYNKRQVIGKPISYGKPNSKITTVAFSTDGSRLYTGSTDKYVYKWDYEQGKSEGDRIVLRSSLTCVAVSSDDRRIATSSFDGAVRFWDAKTGLPIGEHLTHDARVNSIAFSQDGKRIVTGSRDVARVWDVESELPLGVPIRHSGFINAVTFNSDGSQVLTASDQGDARIWDVTVPVPNDESLKHLFWYHNMLHVLDNGVSIGSGQDNFSSLKVLLADQEWIEATQRKRELLSQSVLVDNATKRELQDDWQGARRQWQDLVHLAPEHLFYRLQLANACSQLSDWPAATREFAAAAAMSKSSFELRFDTALVHLASGDVKQFTMETESMLRDAMQSETPDDWFKTVQLCFLVEHSSENTKLALELAMRLIEFDPESDDYQLMHGASLVRNGQYAKALGVLSKTDTQLRMAPYQQAFVLIAHRMLDNTETVDALQQKWLDLQSEMDSINQRWQARIRRECLQQQIFPSGL